MADLVKGLGGAAGFGEITLPRQDDAAFRFDISTVFEQGLTLSGRTLAADAFHVGSNGILSFGQGITGFPPDTGLAGTPVIAPFWADVDVRLDGEGTESGAIHLDIDAATDTVTVTWDRVGRFRRDSDMPNSFQVQLIDRGAGDFDIVFRYKAIGWTSGDLSGGVPALIGLADGGLMAELPASGNGDAQLALPVTPGSGAAGVWQIALRGGRVMDEPWLRQTVTGTEAGDLLSGGPGADLLSGAGGDDTLAGGGGADTLDGGAGRDQAQFGFDLSEAAFFRDGDFLRVTRAGGADAVTLIAVEDLAFADQTVLSATVPLTGGPGDDLIQGSAAADALFGGAGDDTLAGGGGADFLDGGVGFDTARFAADFAGASFDWDGAALLVGIAGVAARLSRVERLVFADGVLTTLPQTLSGTSVDDLLEGGLGHDSLSGSGGDDTLRGGVGHDTLIGGAGADWLIGGSGNDLLIAGADSNLLDGGAGQDRARFDFAFGDALVQALENGSFMVFSAGLVDQSLIMDVETLEFTDLTLTPQQAAAQSGGVIRGGGSGADVLDGGEQADFLTGGGGDDILRGGLGNDTLEGGDGADTLNGGDGDDSILGGATSADLRDVIFAGAGNDWVDGGYGNDEINGMGGDDTMVGGFGADTLIGGDGGDVINGGPLSDLVFGNDGNDFVNGGFGFDRVNGGAGADRFFHLGIESHGSDWIRDFTQTEGDVLLFGQADATFDQFQVNVTNTPGAGDDAIDEAFIIYKPTGQIVWALVDGMANTSIDLQIGGSADTFDLLA